MTEPLDPNHTNTVWCTVCRWRRIIDLMRPYDGKHRNPDGGECYGMLAHRMIVPIPIERVLGEDFEAAYEAEGGQVDDLVKRIEFIAEGLALQDDDLDPLPPFENEQ